jgi:mannose-6-phosphate isomerase-like protein (cupin superfamily)
MCDFYHSRRAPPSGDDRDMTSPEGHEATASSPVSLDAALASFQDLWSPRIVTRVNDYDVRIAKVHGEFVWHVHENTDEFFLVLDGELLIAVREPGGEHEVRLPRGAVFTVPRGVEHRPSAPGGASILMFEPTGTVNVGDRADETVLPAHIAPTSGRRLA